jgi:uncharacterized protein (TIGR03000 family)
VPTEAVVWIGEQRMTQIGTQRTFQSPPLEAGRLYYYRLKITVPRPGQGDLVGNYEVTVRAGQTTSFEPTFPAATQVITSPPVEYSTEPYESRPFFRKFFRRNEGSSYR